MRCEVQFILAALLWSAVAVSAQNITLILDKHPSYSTFNRLLSLTKVADEINVRSSITLLCPDNAVLDPVAAANAKVSLQELGDVLRYHILLQYLDTEELKNMNNGSGVVTTLYQTTGRAQGNDGFVYITDMPNGAVQVGPPGPGAPMQAAILTNFTQYPYNYSFFQLSAVLVPIGVNAPPPAADTVNITEVLVNAGKFTTLVSLLQSTGVGDSFTKHETGAGLVLFAPSDAAFAALPAGALGKLTAAQKITILQYHALPAYYPLGTLQKLSSPLSPTLATESNGAGTYTVDIKSVGTAVTVETGLVNATVTGTLADVNPVAIFSVDKVLLPKEIFAPGPAAAPSPRLGPSLSPTPVPSASAPTPTAATPNPLTNAPFVTPSLAPSIVPATAPAAASFHSPPAPPPSPEGAGNGAPAQSPAANEKSPNAAVFVHCSRALLLLLVSVSISLLF